MKSIEKLREMCKYRHLVVNTSMTSDGTTVANLGSPLVEMIDDIIGNIEVEIAANYLELPKDADGVRIELGDKLIEHEDGHEFIVDGMKIWGSTYEWWAYEDGGVLAPAMRCTHVKPRTLEDVLTEMLDRNTDGVGYREFRGDFQSFVKSYADEIRELMGGDAS